MRRSFERRNAQTSRKGWRPRQTSDKKLAVDIAASLRENPGREVSVYTSNPAVVAMVQELMGK